MNKSGAVKRIWRRPIIYICAAVLAFVCALAVFITGGSDTQRLNLAGYVISVPDTWVIKLDGEVAVFYGEGAGNTPIGKARLLNKETAPVDFGKWFNFESAPIDEKNSKRYAAPLVGQLYSEDGGEYTVYTFSSLPNPQPYHFAMYLDNSYVKKGTAKRILKSFSIPDAGKNPPPKNIVPPAPEEAALNHVCKIIQKNGFTEVHGVSKLDSFIESVNNGESATQSLLAYRKEGDSIILGKWQHLDFDGKRTLLYTYYQTEDGAYSYSNNPKELLSVTRVSDEENGITRYLATDSNGEPIKEALFEYPKNPYEENSEKLLAYKGTKVGDNSAVGAILDLLPTPGMSRVKFELVTEKEPYSIIVNYNITDKDKALYDGDVNSLMLEKNALIIFSLVENADRIVFNVEGEGIKEQLSFVRSNTAEQFDEDVREYALAPQKFKTYLEEIQNIPPERENTQSETEGILGEVVYSTTVTIPHGMMVTHPRTGQKVKIDPYAERYGYAQYLGKPISCVIYRAASGYRAIASCGGTVLLEYALADEKDLNYAIGMIQAYGG